MSGWQDDWRGVALGVVVLGPLAAIIFCLLSVFGVLIPNLFVGMPLALCGVHGLWFWVPSTLAALWGLGFAWFFFYEEILH